MFSQGQGWGELGSKEVQWVWKFNEGSQSQQTKWEFRFRQAGILFFIIIIFLLQGIQYDVFF